MVSGYTSYQLLRRNAQDEVVRSVAATETLNTLRAKYPDYSYREATLGRAFNRMRRSLEKTMQLSGRR